jgi:predicted transglutaminase-like cysteine proteinase
MRLFARAAIAAAFVLAELASVSAAPLFRVPSLLEIEGARTLGFRGQGGVPKGYFELCRGGDAICRIRRARGVATVTNGAVVLSTALAEQLVSTNSSVNRGMRSVADRIQHGVGDVWTVGGSVGDCEDFALTKKMRLLRAGWPSTALLLATAMTQSGQPHAVLVVRTDNGDFILDNLTDRIRGWNQSGLRLRTVQSPTDVWVWHRV